MVSVPLDCPHCGTERVGYHGTYLMPCDTADCDYILLLQCGVCHNGVVAKYRGDVQAWVKSNGQHGAPHLLGRWPKTEPPAAPKHLPDNIRHFYLQGLDSLRRRGYDAAGTMFRKCLDVGLKRLHPDGKGTLQKRIDVLPDTLGITPAMKEWAHEIRDLGNDASHEEEPFSQAEAKTLQSFTEMFLTYAFTLPGMLDERRATDPPE